MENPNDEEETVHMEHARRTGSSPDLGSNTAIGRRLKAYYDDVANEPVPDRFLMLLDALDTAESASKKSPSQ